MRRVFADTYYWIALINDRDQGHVAAEAIALTLQHATLITTQEVLSEVLTYFCEHGAHVRTMASTFIRDILTDPSVKVEPQSDQSFLSGLAFYEARSDKAYSHADCISMLAMQRERLIEVLTHDDHFTQEGFIKLL
jgi:uncharacterized protein